MKSQESRTTSAEERPEGASTEPEDGAKQRAKGNVPGGNGAFRRARNVLIAVVAVLFLLGTVGMGGIGWHFSNVLEDGALVLLDPTPTYDLEVVAVSGDTVTIRPGPTANQNWTKQGIWGLEWEGGYAQVHEILELGDETVTRRLVPVRGELSVGTQVRLDSYAFSGDPLTARGLPFDEVTYPTELGEMPAWLIEGAGSTWAIFVHGRGADRQEALRMLPAAAELGLPSLVISYRNAKGGLPSGDPYYRYGAVEWQDLEAAVQYVLDRGAEDIVLVGFSMGGGIVSNFMYQSELATHVRGIVMDAPMLSFGDTIDYGGERMNIPTPFVFVGKLVSGWRFAIDWAGLDYLRGADQTEVPVLLFHGDDDLLVHMRTSEALAEAHADRVTYVLVPGATHVRAWNMDPEAYETQVREFLETQVLAR